MSVSCWHDLECGRYREDLGLWLRLAAAHGGPVLDIGAGTGRVSLCLARAGHRLVALDLDRRLLRELDRRAGGLPVRTVCGDARDFDLRLRFPLILVPMQTVQLLGGGTARRRFLSCARRHLRSDGCLAVALAEELEEFHPQPDMPLPPPDVCERAGVRYISQPTAIRAGADGFTLERTREIQAGGAARISQDRIRLDRLAADTLEREGRSAGLRPVRRVAIPATEDYAASTVVMFGG